MIEDTFDCGSKVCKDKFDYEFKGQDNKIFSDYTREDLLSLLDVIELCADSYMSIIEDKQSLLDEYSDTTTHPNCNLSDIKVDDTCIPGAVQFDLVKEFVNSSAFWNDLLLLQSEVIIYVSAICTVYE